MESEFKRICCCMIDSDTIADGEYYVIHADHIHDFKRAIEHYFEEDKTIESIPDWTVSVGIVDDSNIEEYIHKLFEQESILYYKINEIIDKINRMENK